MGKRIIAIFFIILISHAGLVIPKMKSECSCHIFSETFSPCCNCSQCVAQRGGFLSACACHEKSTTFMENFPSIKRMFCFCGLSASDFDLPGVKYPVIVSEGLFLPLVLEIHHFLPILSSLSSQVYLTPPEHPS